jgi:hypothetical protein
VPVGAAVLVDGDVEPVALLDSDDAAQHQPSKVGDRHIEPRAPEHLHAVHAGFDEGVDTGRAEVVNLDASRHKVASWFREGHRPGSAGADRAVGVLDDVVEVDDRRGSVRERLGRRPPVGRDNRLERAVEQVDGIDEPVDGLLRLAVLHPVAGNRRHHGPPYPLGPQGEPAP